MQALDSFKAFVAGAEDRHEQPATFTQPELIGDYRTFDDPDDHGLRRLTSGPAGSTQ